MKHFLSLAVLFTLSLSSLSFALEQELTQLFTDLMKADTASGKKVTAIMPFQASGNGLTEAQGQSVAEFGVVMFQSSGRYTVVERAQLVKAVEELKLAQSGLMEESNSIQVGRLLSAERLVMGSITNLFGKRMISGRIVETATGQVVSSASITVAANDLDGFAKQVLGEAGNVSASLFRSAVAPGWGQIYTGNTLRGGVSLGVFVAAAGFLGYSIFSSSSKLNDFNTYNDYLGTPQWQDDITARLQAKYAAGLPIDSAVQTGLIDSCNQRRDNLYSSYSSAFTRVIIAGALTGAVYAFNLADAALCGMQAKKKFNLYFSRTPRETIHVDVAWSF